METQRLLVRNVSVIDVVAGAALPGRTVVIADGTIVSLLEGPAPASGASAEIRADGLFALPGLFDCHVHLGGSPGPQTDPREWHLSEVECRLAAYLACGVTTVRSLCDSRTMIASLRSRLATGELVGPDILHCGLALTAPGSHPVSQLRHDPSLLDVSVRQVARAAEAEGVVRELIGAGVDVIKVYLDDRGGTTQKLGRDVLAIAVATAHDGDLPVTAHVGTLDDVRVAVAAGVDGIEHLAVHGEARVSEALADRRFPLFFCPTIVVAESLARFPELPDVATDEWTRSRLSPFMTFSLAKWHRSTRRAGGRHDSRIGEALPAAHQQVAAFRAAGVTVVAGSDAGNHGTFHGASLLREISLLRDGGMSRSEALRAATIDAARCCRVDAELGSIEPGKAATFVLLEGNPLEELGHLRRVRGVVQRGVYHSIETLLTRIAG